jgi:hypothetical protein
MNRHVRQYCKIANSDEGMEKLMDRTIQRQLAEQSTNLAEQKTKLAEQDTKIDRLTTLLLEHASSWGRARPCPR